MKLIHYIIVFYCLLGFPSYASAMSADSVNVLKIKADSAYSCEEFARAEQLYLLLAQQGESAAIYYNLACTYYRLDDMAKAILWFERAALLEPSDDDIRFNLTMARNKTIDRIIPRHEMFFVSSWRTLMHSHSVTQWAYFAIGAFATTLLLLSIYIYCSAIVLRKIGFFGAIFAFILCILFNVLAYNLRYYNKNNNFGIIMESSVTVRSTPTKSGTDLFVIHEGTRVEVRDNSMRDWAEVQIADGKVGWIEKSSYEAI